MGSSLTHSAVAPRGTTSFPDRGSYEYDQLCLLCLGSCLGLLSCIELCIFLCPLVLFTLVISFATKGFPCKDQTKELFIVMVHCMYSQHITLSTLSLISLFKLQHADERHGIVYLL